MTGAAPGSWPREQLVAVGKAYRAAAGRGFGCLASVEAAEAVYLAAAGEPEGANRTVVAMLNYLSCEHEDWLSGPRRTG